MKERTTKIFKKKSPNYSSPSRRLKEVITIPKMILCILLLLQLHISHVHTIPLIPSSSSAETVWNKATHHRILDQISQNPYCSSIFRRRKRRKWSFLSNMISSKLRAGYILNDSDDGDDEDNEDNEDNEESLVSSDDEDNNHHNHDLHTDNDDTIEQGHVEIEIKELNIVSDDGMFDAEHSANSCGGEEDYHQSTDDTLSEEEEEQMKREEYVFRLTSPERIREVISSWKEKDLMVYEEYEQRQIEQQRQRQQHEMEKQQQMEQDADSNSDDDEEEKKRSISTPAAPPEPIIIPQHIEESHKLQTLLYTRAEEYIQELEESYLLYQEKISTILTSKANKPKKKIKIPTFTPPNPKRLLLYIAPKVPAIKHSPEIMLRIRSAQANVDMGIASSTIGILAALVKLHEHTCKMAEGLLTTIGNGNGGSSSPNSDSEDEDGEIKGKGGNQEALLALQMLPSTVSKDIIEERRFEQLVECVMCGVDVSNQEVVAAAETLKMKMDSDEMDGYDLVEEDERKEEESDHGLIQDNENDKSRDSDIGHIAGDENNDIKEEEFDQRDTESMETEALGEEEEEEEIVADIVEHQETIVQKLEGIDIEDSARAAWGISVLGAYKLPSLGGEDPKDLLLALSLRSRELMLHQLESLRGNINQNNDEEYYTNDPNKIISYEIIPLVKEIVLTIWAFTCVNEYTSIHSQSLFESLVKILCQNEGALLKKRITSHHRIEDEIVERLARAEELSSEVEVQEEDVEKRDHDEDNDKECPKEEATSPIVTEEGAQNEEVDNTNVTSCQQHKEQDETTLIFQHITPREMDTVLQSLALQKSISAKKLEKLLLDHESKKAENKEKIQVIDAATLLSS